MTKEVAKGKILAWSLCAKGHPVTCECGGTAEGVATVHQGKTAEEYAAILAASQG